MEPIERETTIVDVAGGRLLHAVALDGPLRAGFQVIGRYRTAERMLTRRLRPRIGKPGQSSAPVGIKLNAAANDSASVALQRCRVGPARHATRIDERAVVEAFPSSFLGVMIKDPAAVAAKRDNRSDRYFEHLTATGVLQDLLSYLLPARTLSQSLTDVRNHDDRAALICALTALTVAAGDFTAVGDIDGWIVLPPRCFVQGWAWDDLNANAHDETPGSLYEAPSCQASDPPRPVDRDAWQASGGRGAVTMPVDVQNLFEKIQALPQDRLGEVEDFVDFLQLRDRQRALARDAAAASEPAFAAVWSNPEDDVYDAL